MRGRFEGTSVAAMINLRLKRVVVGLFWVSSICRAKLGFIMTVASKPKTKFSYCQALNYRGVRELSHNEKLGVSLFLLAFFVVVGAWLLDEDYISFKPMLTHYTKWPMTSFGWTQYWGLFSPDVRQSNYHSTALIEFADGTNKLYEFPRTLIDQTDYSTHFGGEKRRKLFGDNFLWSGYAQFWPSIARYIARANNDPTNPPRVVTFTWHYADMPAPDPAQWKYRNQMPNHTQQIIKFCYKVTPEDLASNQAVSTNK